MTCTENPENQSVRERLIKIKSAYMKPHVTYNRKGVS